jgi:hypothetical protein
MYKWAFDIEKQAELCVELSIELRVDDLLMARVHGRRTHPSARAIYPSLEAYIDASRAALIADMHTRRTRPRSPPPRPPTASAGATAT